MSLPFISKCKIVKQKGFSFDEIVQSWTKEIASVLFYLFYITLGLFNSLQKCIFRASSYRQFIFVSICII